MKAIDNKELILALEELEKEKGIKKEYVLEAIETALVTAYKRNFDALENVKVDIDKQTGATHIYAIKDIMENANDDATEITLEEAQKINRDLQLGDTVAVEIVPKDFGRIAAPQVLISRSHPDFVRKLLEFEIPEIYEGLIEIKSVSRDPGYRSKVAVYSPDENIDPVGSCVGNKGVRIQNVINELSGEKIDVIEWNADPSIYIASALLPAQILAVDIKEEEKFAQVIVPDDQLSLAIGKSGQNARLAAKLTNWKIDIKSESQFRQILIEKQAESEEVKEDEE